MSIVKICLLIFVLFCCFPFYGQSTTAGKASKIVKVADKYHITPKIVNDTFSVFVFNKFMDLLDPNKIYFSKQDYNILEAGKFSLDDEILAEESNFLNDVTNLYQQKIVYSDSLIESFRNEKMDFSERDSLVIRSDDSFLEQKELDNRWKKIIKAQILSGYFGQLDSANTNRIPDEQELMALKQKVLDRQLCRIKSRLNHHDGIYSYTSSCYLKSIANAYDPHTQYFSELERKRFVQSLSKNAYSFGFSIVNNEYGDIEISEIIPGSPAWNSNDLNEGDVILKVTSGGVEKEMDCISVNEFSEFISSDTLASTGFTIRKKSGKVILVTLTKEIVDVESNVVTSYVLCGDAKKNGVGAKIGYIYLPSFYLWSADGGNDPRGCASDVARELIQLRDENIDGLIIDVRSNGGGSMREAFLMSGIFIDYGAIAIIQQKGEGYLTQKDLNRGVIYSDPLVILTDEFSASASEMFAASMQDQNRAVIVGAKTYGKSTFQEILPLNVLNNESAGQYEDSEDGYLKITEGAFYRVTGKSHQWEGVIPDIILPSPYDSINIGEKNYPSALEPTFVNKKTYYYPLPKLPIDELNRLSQKRVQENKLFEQLMTEAEAIKKKMDYYSIPLSLKAYQQWNETDDLDLVSSSQVDSFEVRNTAYYQTNSLLDSVKIEMNSQNLDNIQQDFILGEAYLIINDLINITK